MPMNSPECRGDQGALSSSVSDLLLSFTLPDSLLSSDGSGVTGLWNKAHGSRGVGEVVLRGHL